ncbi:MAG: ABC transporter ATP-binding protein [Deltaproteobacteria bacterium]|nr:ABC transporter ATP-binding protein [Deltaproteobacteria bacterium]
MLELKDVHTYYGESHVLNGISLRVEEASVVTLLGRNGMGKTTTVRSIIGFTPPRSGIVRFKGTDVQHLPAYKICQMGLALVPQGRRIFPSLSVEENLMIAARGEGWTLEKIHALFPILKARGRHKGNLLSGGEQQMAAIARALLTNPEFLLMDEPSEGLAPLIVSETGDIISKLKGKGLSIFLVEQNVPLALSVADYAYILHNGQIVHHCSAEELGRNEKLQAEYIGVAKRKVKQR